MPVIQSSVKSIRKNSTGTVYRRPQINLIEGTGITITVSDDPSGGEVDITLDSTGSGGVSMGVAQLIASNYVTTYITALS